jgi:hypothetical protein
MRTWHILVVVNEYTYFKCHGTVSLTLCLTEDTERKSQPSVNAHPFALFPCFFSFLPTPLPLSYELVYILLAALLNCLPCITSGLYYFQPWLRRQDLQTKELHLWDRAIAQAVSHRLPTAVAWFQSRVRSCGICDGQRFTPSILVPLVIFIPPTAPYYSSPYHRRYIVSILRASLNNKFKIYWWIWDSHSVDYEEFCLLGYNAVMTFTGLHSVMSQTAKIVEEL